MPRRLVAAAGVTAAALALAAAPAVAAPQTRDVIVTLRDQAALAGGGASTARRLRAAAAVGQRNVLGLLRLRRRQGRVRLVRRYWVFNGLRVVAAKSVVDELAALPDVASVRPNRVIRAPARTPRARRAEALDSYGAGAIGAPALWAAGITGTGVVVADLDSGVDASHPALAASFRGGANSWLDPSGEHPARPFDAGGHGTWTTGIMVGSGAGGTPVGVAPGARWIAAKVFDDRGATTIARIHTAFQWLLDPDGDPRTADAPNVVNASWDAGGGGCDLEFEDDLRHLRAAGIVTVFPAGNGGDDANPANNPSAFAVGSVDERDALGFGSGRGPSSCGQPFYPQVVAPGVDVATTDLFGLSTRQSGTSMAAPFVSGSLALLLSRFPGLSAQRQQAAIESTASDLGRAGPDQRFGYGRVDVSAALGWLQRAPDVALSPARWAVPATRGRRAAVTADLTRLHGFSGAVTVSVLLRAGGVRAGARAARVAAGTRRARRVIRLDVPRALRPGTYPLTIKASSGTLRRAVTVALVVRSPRRAKTNLRGGGRTAP